MAFLESQFLVQKERFSLLLLEPGEIYFEDFSVFCYPVGFPEHEAMKKKQRGRLKLCSKSLVFDPIEYQHPILKFSFKDITKLQKWTGQMLSKVDSQDKMVHLRASMVTEMKEDNVIAPYNFKKEDSEYVFNLTYQTVEECLPQMCQLLRASTLPRADQSAMINAIVMSRRSRVKFDTSWLENLYEEIKMESQGDRVTPLVTNPGRIMLTSCRLYFQPFNNVTPFPVLKIKLSDIQRVIKRRFLLRHVGLEIYCENNTACRHLYLAMTSQEERDSLYNNILQQPDVQLEDTVAENMTLRWQNRAISNFDYLLYLNSMADRSINDLTQYPVFPWVISDWTSSSLDLSDENVYRDLSKPIGALNEERLKRLLERFSDMPEPRFLYGSHYSTPGFVLFYLARIAPEYMLCLQNGRFDHPDRMFNSIQDAWRNCLSSYSDFKELIPEFYDSKGEFLQANPSISFGSRHDGKVVAGVELPPWASSPEDFIKKLREALESEYVSEHLHHWVDLIFGYKQRGEEAEKAYNLFYYLTYEGSVDLESITDLNQRAALENQIMEFGQTPKQLFTFPHPKRGQQCLSPSPSSGNQANYCDSNNEASVIVQDSDQNIEDIITAEGSTVLMPWANMSNLKVFHEYKLHKEPVTDIKWCSKSRTIFSVAQDAFLKIYSLNNENQLRSIHISNMAMSACILLNNGKSVITGSWDNNIYLYSVEYGRMLESFSAHNDAVSCLWHHNDILLSGSWDSTVKMWELSMSDSNNPQLQLLGEFDHDSGVEAISLCPEGNTLAAGTQDGTVTLWDIHTCSSTLTATSHSGTVTAVSFSPDGEKLVSCGEDGFIKVLDIHTSTEVFVKDWGEKLLCLQWDGLTLLTGTQSGLLSVWDMVNDKLLSSIQAHDGAVTCINVTGCGEVITGGEDRRIVLWKP